MGYWRVNVHV